MGETRLIQGAGGQPTNKPPKHAPIVVATHFTGLVTNRNPLIELASRAEKRFYGGRPDSLFGEQIPKSVPPAP